MEVVEVGTAEGVEFLAAILVGVAGYGGGGWRLQFYQAGDMWQAVGVVAVALGHGVAHHNHSHVALIVVDPCVEFSALQVAVRGQDFVYLTVADDVVPDIVGRVGGSDSHRHRAEQWLRGVDDAVTNSRRIVGIAYRLIRFAAGEAVGTLHETRRRRQVYRVVVHLLDIARQVLHGVAVGIVVKLRFRRVKNFGVAQVARIFKQHLVGMVRNTPQTVAVIKHGQVVDRTVVAKNIFQPLACQRGDVGVAVVGVCCRVVGISRRGGVFCRGQAVGVVVDVGVLVALGDRLGDVAVVAGRSGPGGVAELLRETRRRDGGQRVAHVVAVADSLAQELGGREAAKRVAVTRLQCPRPSRHRQHRRH